MVEIQHIDDCNDKRLQPFARTLKRLKSENDMVGRGFVVEGVELVKRLLASSLPYVAKIILCVDSRVDSFVRENEKVLQKHRCEVLSCNSAIINKVGGYKFTRGVMAVGQLACEMKLEDYAKSGVLLVCEHVENEENLGVMIRTAAALGMESVLLGEKGVSPHARRVIRVSMGNVFNVPVVRSGELIEDLKKLSTLGYEIVGAAVDDTAVSVHEYTQCKGRGVALVVGNEPCGLSESVLTLCDTKLMIPIEKATDSLNVSVAAGILMCALQSKVSH